MRRRSMLVAPIGGIVAGIAAPVARGAPAGQTEVDSGGIGLDRATWETFHGPGNAGQSSVTYDGGRIVVQFDGGVVSFIEFGWEDTGGIDAADATAQLEALLPADATLVETFVAPATGDGPIALQIDRYESASLPARYPDASPAPTGGIVAVIQLRRATDRMEPYATRVSLAIGYST